jgi:hypothetical protein
MINANQIRLQHVTEFQLWDGEMTVHAFQHIGAHGFPSAAIVITRMDDPIETRVWSGYGRYKPSEKPTEAHMSQWIADQLNRLATGAYGSTSAIVEIRSPDVRIIYG